MATKAKGGLNKNTSYIPGRPKKSRQGTGNGTKYAASSRNGSPKKYRGQGKGWDEKLTYRYLEEEKDWLWVV